MVSKTVILILGVLAALAVTVHARARPEDTPAYTTKFDDFDIDKVLSNRRLLENYYKCLVERGPCPKDATELKRILPDALQTKCSKCSEKQKAAAEKVVRHISEKEAEMWKELKAKYDPEGKWEGQYKSEAKEHGIKV